MRSKVVFVPIFCCCWHAKMNNGLSFLSRIYLSEGGGGLGMSYQIDDVAFLGSIVDFEAFFLSPFIDNCWSFKFDKADSNTNL